MKTARGIRNEAYDMDIEICSGSVEEVQLAARMRADRVELCNALETGGLTPSIGMIKAACEVNGPEVHVLIRPRAGDFVYHHDELKIMDQDIESAARTGAAGVVFGVLTSEGWIDTEENRRLLSKVESLGMEATFHRAIDVAADPIESLDRLIDLGFSRVLTSGQAATAIQGIDVIRQLTNRAEGRIQIMAGSGVSHENVATLAAAGIDALHFTSRKVRNSESAWMGDTFEPDEKKITSILETLNDARQF